MNNNTYPTVYPSNTFQQNYMNQMGFQTQPQNQNNLFATFAQGRQGADQYPVAAGSMAIIIDSTPNSNVFYLKDNTGKGKPLRIFDYTEREEVDETKELNDLKTEVADLKALVASLAKPLQELIGPANGKEDNHE